MHAAACSGGGFAGTGRLAKRLSSYVFSSLALRELLRPGVRPVLRALSVPAARRHHALRATLLLSTRHDLSDADLLRTGHDLSHELLLRAGLFLSLHLLLRPVQLHLPASGDAGRQLSHAGPVLPGDE